MSERKSWDIQPKRRAPAQAPALSAEPRRVKPPMEAMRPRTSSPREVAAAAAPVTKKGVTIARGKKTRPEAKEPLKKRRKKAKKALFVALSIAAALLLVLLVIAAWQPAFRINDVVAEGPHAEEARGQAAAELRGTYFFVLPRNSLFFIPERDIRARLLAAYPDVEAVSMKSKGLQTIAITLVPRAEAFVWCGTARALEHPCYSANAEGLLFAETATTTALLRMYGPIEGQEGESPIRGRLAHAPRVSEALRFVKAMQTLGADVAELTFREDEADLYTEAGTRITYVLGREEEAAGIAASVFPQLALNDGSIQYVDLRFSGKAYFKRAEALAP